MANAAERAGERAGLALGGQHGWGERDVPFLASRGHPVRRPDMKRNRRLACDRRSLSKLDFIRPFFSSVCRNFSIVVLSVLLWQLLRTIVAFLSFRCFRQGRRGVSASNAALNAQSVRKLKSKRMTHLHQLPAACILHFLQSLASLLIFFRCIFSSFVCSCAYTSFILLTCRFVTIGTGVGGCIRRKSLRTAGSGTVLPSI